MTRFVIALLGGGVGIGLMILVRAFRNRNTDLEVLAGTLTSSGRSVAQLDQPDDGSTGRTSKSWSVGLLNSFGVGDLELTRSRLRVVDKSIEQHAFEKLTAAVAGFTFPLIFMLMLILGGIQPPILLLFVASLVLAVGGFLYPELPLKDLVVERRRSFRHALGSYLELVCVMLAGGAGTQTALAAAAESGAGWPFVELRRAIDRAAATNRPVSELFEELSAELGVDDLRDLSASLSLAGGHGARVKESLIAKSDAMRHSLATDFEGMAETQTEKMIIPVAIMTLGLTLFVGFAALAAIGDGGTVSDVVPPNPIDQFSP